MIAFEVKDMTCGHCVSTIAKAVQNVDADAKVRIDLATHRVEIEPAQADARALGAAIEEAGYAPMAVEETAEQPAPTGSAQRSGCCCR